MNNVLSFSSVCQIMDFDLKHEICADPENPENWKVSIFIHCTFSDQERVEFDTFWRHIYIFCRRALKNGEWKPGLSKLDRFSALVSNQVSFLQMTAQTKNWQENIYCACSAHSRETHFKTITKPRRYKQISRDEPYFGGKNWARFELRKKHTIGCWYNDLFVPRKGLWVLSFAYKQHPWSELIIKYCNLHRSMVISISAPLFLPQAAVRRAQLQYKHSPSIAQSFFSNP